MTSVDENLAPEAALLPRFDDGMANLQELVRALAEVLVNQVMDAEAGQLCGGGANSRNGYRELGVDPKTLRGWMAAARGSSAGAKARPKGAASPFEAAEEPRRLGRENERLRRENEILLKASAFFAGRRL